MGRERVGLSTSDAGFSYDKQTSVKYRICAVHVVKVSNLWWGKNSGQRAESGPMLVGKQYPLMFRRFFLRYVGGALGDSGDPGDETAMSFFGQLRARAFKNRILEKQMRGRGAKRGKWFAEDESDDEEDHDMGRGATMLLMGGAAGMKRAKRRRRRDSYDEIMGAGEDEEDEDMITRSSSAERRRRRRRRRKASSDEDGFMVTTASSALASSPRAARGSAKFGEQDDESDQEMEFSSTDDDDLDNEFARLLREKKPRTVAAMREADKLRRGLREAKLKRRERRKKLFERLDFWDNLLSQKLRKKLLASSAPDADGGADVVMKTPTLAAAAHTNPIALEFVDGMMGGLRATLQLRVSEQKERSVSVVKIAQPLLGAVRGELYPLLEQRAALGLGGGGALSGGTQTEIGMLGSSGGFSVSPASGIISSSGMSPSGIMSPSGMLAAAGTNTSTGSGDNVGENREKIFSPRGDILDVSAGGALVRGESSISSDAAGGVASLVLAPLEDVSQKEEEVHTTTLIIPQHVGQNRSTRKLPVGKNTHVRGNTGTPLSSGSEESEDQDDSGAPPHEFEEELLENFQPVVIKVTTISDESLRDRRRKTLFLEDIAEDDEQRSPKERQLQKDRAKRQASSAVFEKTEEQLPDAAILPPTTGTGAAFAKPRDRRYQRATFAEDDLQENPTCQDESFQNAPPAPRKTEKRISVPSSETKQRRTSRFQDFQDFQRNMLHSLTPRSAVGGPGGEGMQASAERQLLRRDVRPALIRIVDKQRRWEISRCQGGGRAPPGEAASPTSPTTGAFIPKPNHVGAFTTAKPKRDDVFGQKLVFSQSADESMDSALDDDHERKQELAEERSRKMFLAKRRILQEQAMAQADLSRNYLVDIQTAGTDAHTVDEFVRFLEDVQVYLMDVVQQVGNFCP